MLPLAWLLLQDSARFGLNHGYEMKGVTEALTRIVVACDMIIAARADGTIAEPPKVAADGATMWSKRPAKAAKPAKGDT